MSNPVEPLDHDSNPDVHSSQPEIVASESASGNPVLPSPATPPEAPPPPLTELILILGLMAVVIGSFAVFYGPLLGEMARSIAGIFSGGSPQP